jgi:hypothetical protein
VADIQILAGGVVTAPLAYVIPGRQEIVVKALFAAFDGTNASGSFLPCVRILSPAGKVVGEYITDSGVAPGASAEVSWAPFLRSGGGGGMTVIYDNLLSAPSPSFDITGIPSTFRALLLLTNLRTNGVATNADSLTVVNGNTSPTNYFYVNSAGAKLQSTTHSVMVSSSGSSADSQHAAPNVVWCHDYAQVLNDHAFVGHAGNVPVEADNTSWYARAISVQSCCTVAAPVSRLTISPDVGTAWVPPSQVTLYGVG